MLISDLELTRFHGATRGVVNGENDPCDETDPLLVMPAPKSLVVTSPDGNVAIDAELDTVYDAPPLDPDAKENKAGCVGIEDIVFDCVMLILRGGSSL